MTESMETRVDRDIAILRDQIPVAEAALSLVGDPRFKIVHERLLEARERAVKSLLGKELTPYEQGRAQGIFNSMSVMLSLLEKSPQDLADMRQRLDDLLKKREHRNMIRPEVDPGTEEFLRDLGYPMQGARTS